MKTVLLKKNSGGISARVFSPECGEITFHGTFMVGDARSPKEYKQIPYLRLFVDDYDPENGNVFVTDDYFPLLPHLKPIGAFRDYFWRHMLPNALDVVAVRQSPMLTAGVNHYAEKLVTFSEDASVVRQAKTATNHLRHEKARDVKIALAVLRAFGRTPSTDVPFSVE